MIDGTTSVANSSSTPVEVPMPLVFVFCVARVRWIFGATIIFDIRSLWIIGIPVTLPIVPCLHLVVFVGLFPSLAGFVVPCALPALWFSESCSSFLR
jgi:hypothetical protein